MQEVRRYSSVLSIVQVVALILDPPFHLADPMSDFAPSPVDSLHVDTVVRKSASSRADQPKLFKCQVRGSPGSSLTSGSFSGVRL
jgi:hypothetical protein